MEERGHELGRAWVDHLHDRIERARHSAGAAAARGDDPAVEAEALVLGAWAATRQGHFADALDQAAQAVGLAATLPDDDGHWRLQALAHLSLGLTLGWAGDEARSRPAFATALHLCRRFGSPRAARQVLTEQRWVQLLRRATLPGQPPIVEPPAGDAAAGEALAPWPADFVDACEAASLALAGGRVPPAGPSWLGAAEAWARAEAALAQGDAEAASVHAQQLVRRAEQAVHVPLVLLGRRLGAEALARQGAFELAHAERAACDALLQRLAAEQCDRQLERAAQQLALRIEGRSAQRDRERLHRWAYEDALTGIANLRQFNETLERWNRAAADGDQRLSVALIDVDRFKRINDGHGHEAGDAVLRGIASLMRAHVRDGDLPARWGGDEFAVLFRGADQATADQVAARIADAVEAHDWSAIAPGLEVSVSVGVVEAAPGDDQQKLVSRSDRAMYECKRRRERRRVEKTVPPALLRRVLGWLRHRRRVVFLFGDASEDSVRRMAPSARLAFFDALARGRDAPAFSDWWRDWRHAHEGRRPGEAQQAAVALGRLLPEPAFITEDIDGTLAMAGAHGVIELYGNGFRTRCAGCGLLDPVVREQRCAACGGALRPDVVLLGEPPDGATFAKAELLLKLAEVVIAVDADFGARNTVALLHKAAARDARIVVVGPAGVAAADLPHVHLAGEPAPLLRLLADDLRHGVADAPQASGLSEAGEDALAYLGGHGVDDQGRTLDDALAWMRTLRVLPLSAMPWMFPLLTRSAVNPNAPMPTRADFAVLAATPAAQAGMRSAFVDVLALYGLSWDETEGRVHRSTDWRQGFAQWAPSGGAHDLFLSRMLGALTLCDLRREAAALLAVLLEEAPRWRGDAAARPMAFWRLAVRADGGG